jgi:hypothetical protein
MQILWMFDILAEIRIGNIISEIQSVIAWVHLHDNCHYTDKYFIIVNKQTGIGHLKSEVGPSS